MAICPSTRKEYTILTYYQIGPPSPHAHPNPHCAPCSRLSLSGPTSMSVLAMMVKKLRICQVVDPANSRSTLSCQIPEVAFKFYFAGSSYGQLICSRDINCLIMHVFTGAKVLPRQLPLNIHGLLC
jgi:hypothetical protein